MIYRYTYVQRTYFSLSRFVPYVGIVTILMNDYPKCKVSYNLYQSILIAHLFFELFGFLSLDTLT